MPPCRWAGARDGGGSRRSGCAPPAHAGMQGHGCSSSGRHVGWQGGMHHASGGASACHPSRRSTPAPAPPRGSTRRAQRTPRGWPLWEWGWEHDKTALSQRGRQSSAECFPVTVIHDPCRVHTQFGYAIRRARQLHKKQARACAPRLRRPFLTLLISEAQLGEGLEAVAPPAPAVLLDQIQHPAVEK